MRGPQEDQPVPASTTPSCAALLLATCSVLAVWVAAERPLAHGRPPNQDQFGSTQQAGAWNPDSPAECRKFVDEYNRLTPQIYAANAARDFARRHDLTVERKRWFDAYWKCVASQRPLLKGTVTETVPGPPPSYPSPQMIGTASQCGPQSTATNCPGNARPWRGSNWIPALTLNGIRYTRELVSVNIVDYVSMPQTYQTEVVLESSGNRAYTHAFGDVNTRRKTFTVTSVRDKDGRDIPISRPVVIRLR
jgi:hypothetical protein